MEVDKALSKSQTGTNALDTLRKIAEEPPKCVEYSNSDQVLCPLAEKAFQKARPDIALDKQRQQKHFTLKEVKTPTSGTGAASKANAENKTGKQGIKRKHEDRGT